MNPRALISALYSVEVVLREADVLRASEKFTVVLPLDAGRRIEAWLTANPVEEMIHGEQFHTAVHNAGDRPPLRSITLRGITVRWPLELEATYAGSRPRPLHVPSIFSPPGMFDRRVPRFAEDFGDESSGC